MTDPRSYSSLISNSDAALTVGGGGLPGALDEVRLSAVARYTGTTYLTPTLPFACDTHTRALWHLDEEEGATSFHDACGAGNVLTLHSITPTWYLYLPIIGHKAD